MAEPGGVPESRAMLPAQVRGGNRAVESSSDSIRNSPGWPSLVNSPAAVTGIEEAFLRKDAAPFPWGDQRFESVFLQRPVCLTSAFHAYRRKDPAFAGSVSLDETRERDVLAPSRLALAAFL